eukprot:GEMP01067210.1.p1 GENE.GEMP01067210.1~~GEMP01067210.1.p1  ORF type:complete len:220 (-),score=59.46 GEMP01067210.1:542-1201(-)
MGGCFSPAHGGPSGAVVHSAYLQPPPSSASNASTPTKASASQPRAQPGPQNGDRGAAPPELSTSHPSAVPAGDSSPKSLPAASSNAARHVFNNLKPATPPFGAMGSSNGQREYKGKRKKLPAAVDTSTSDTPAKSPRIATPGARTPKMTNTHSTNGYTVDDLWAASSPRIDHQRKLSDPLIRVLSPIEVARGDGVVQVVSLFLDDDGDEADEFLLCDPG